MAGDGLLRRRRLGPPRRAPPADRSPARAWRSVLWHARYSSCRWRWRAARSDGCGGTPLAGGGAGSAITQQLKQLRRQHGVAVFASFALLNPQQHALGVDIADLERDLLGDAQPGAVGGSECRL